MENQERSHYKQMTDFFLSVGANDIDHSDKSYLGHVIGVYNYLKQRGCDEAICDAGMFHSIYGTELFTKFALPLERRDELKALIGERAENLGYLFSAMKREPFDEAVFQEEGPWPLEDRFTGETVMLDEDVFHDMLVLQVYDWLEQVARLGWWDYRRKGYRQMAERLGGDAWEEYQKVFAQENTEPDTAATT